VYPAANFPGPLPRRSWRGSEEHPRHGDLRNGVELLPTHSPQDTVLVVDPGMPAYAIKMVNYIMMIEVHDLTKVYNDKRGLSPVSFAVEKGEFIAVIGHNGAGKSTLLKMLSGWLLPDNGEVLVDGTDLRNRTALARKVGFVPETPNLFDFFSVDYNLKLFARLFQLRRHE